MQVSTLLSRKNQTEERRGEEGRNVELRRR